jgi:acetyl esterase/lipase
VWRWIALGGLGALAVLGVWIASDERARWQVREFAALAALGGEAGRASSAPFAGTEVKVSFGSDAQQYALVFTPPSTAPRRNTAVVFVHGGGWNMGNAEQYRFVGRYFANLGYRAALLGYRLAPQHRYPAQLEDVRVGLRVSIQRFESEGRQVGRFVLGGHSAGAQLAALLTYDSSLGADVRSRLAGMFCLSGPLDFSLCQTGRIRTLIDGYLGNLENRAVADPIQLVSSAVSVPVLCFHGANDPVVNFENSASFVNAVNRLHPGTAQARIIPNAVHSDVMNLFLQPSPDAQALRDWLEGIDKR